MSPVFGGFCSLATFVKGYRRECGGLAWFDGVHARWLMIACLLAFSFRLSCLAFPASGDRVE